MAGSRSPRINPFHYGDVATGEYFTDREDELRALLGDVRSGQNVLLMSPRRYGKTSLIMAAITELRAQEQALVAYVDLLRATTKAELAGLLATAIYEGLVSPFEQALQRIGELFANLPIRPKVSVSTAPDGTVSPSIGFGAAAAGEDTDATIDELLRLPGDVARKRKKRVALVVDEFQAILDLDALLPQRMRAVFQFQGDVAHVYLGSKQHLLHRVFTKAHAPLYNSARIFPLGPIADDRFAAFIRARFASTSVVITEAAITRILAVTGGHPHDTQKLCYFVWNLADAAGTRATPDTVELALQQVLTTDTGRFTEVWESLTPNQRRVLGVVAREGEHSYVLSQGFREAHGLKSYRAVEYALQALVERSLVERVDVNHYAVPDVFLARWLRPA